MVDDAAFMARALALARKGRFTSHPNPAVGCVLVRQGQIVGEGFHGIAGGPHAEIYALQSAREQARGATAYVTLEPCSHQGKTPPCCDALIAAGVRRVVVALADPNPQVASRGLSTLECAGIEVTQGVLAAETRALINGFLKRMQYGLPRVTLKLASSLDGHTALATGESQWITSRAARSDVQRFRAESAAILTTSATVLADDPRLTVRWEELSQEIQEEYPQEAVRQPIRIVLDRHHRVPTHAQIFTQPGQVWGITTSSSSVPLHKACYHELIVVRADQKQRIDLGALFHCLGERGVNSVWVEAGATLAGALLQARLVDELVLYLAPKLLGTGGRSLCDLPKLTQLDGALTFTFTEVHCIGNDLRLHLQPMANGTVGLFTTN